MQACVMHLCILNWNSNLQHHTHQALVQNNHCVHKCFSRFKRTMGDKFNIDEEINNRHRLGYL